MKKNLCLLAALFAAALCLTACTSGETTPDVPQTPDAAQDQPLETEMYFGKVKNIIGNEITLDLAKNPNAAFDDAPAMMEEGDGQAAMPAMSLMAAAPAGSVPDVPVEEHMELEYLGEEKAFTVPAGVTIFDLTHGQEVTLSTLKKGAVVHVTTQAGTNVVLGLDIWE